MTITVKDRKTGKVVECGDTIIGTYGEPWIFLSLTSPTSIWLRDPITLQTVDLDPTMLFIDVDIRG